MRQRPTPTCEMLEPDVTLQQFACTQIPGEFRDSCNNLCTRDEEHDTGRALGLLANIIVQNAPSKHGRLTFQSRHQNVIVASYKPYVAADQSIIRFATGRIFDESLYQQAAL